MTRPTAAQTLGPFYNYAFLRAGEHDLTRGGQHGPAITVTGKLYDGEGAARRDFLMEWWQADASGQYATGADAAFRGFGRCITRPDGSFTFVTVKPGAVPFDAEPGGNRWQAPHAALGIFGPGLMRRIVTRVYFADEDNSACPVLSLVPEARRGRLIAVKESEASYRLDIRMNGEGETPFFAE
ncbi:MAG: protocatechuate 3,4-dioxygenase subunit alpha [Alphaproteobacteria bacterium]|nr:protocatechuate 3,4-dioxygenase subunit alpha [Alphaproteobacteria bacterium]MCB9931142.1 protocatechuate 3,4-dioxygenase subunit alpha [Alphaproteobacteria bacterium]